MLSRLKILRNAGTSDRPLSAWLLTLVPLALSAVKKITCAGTEVEAKHELHNTGEEILRQFVSQAPVAMAMFDSAMVYMACSRRWIEDYRLDGVNIIGRCHYDVFSDLPERWKEPHRRGMAGEVRADDDVFLRVDGREQWLPWTVSPWRTGDQTVGGITIITEDVTDKVLAQRALREKELRLRLAQEAAKGGAWEWRLADDQIWWIDSRWSLRRLVRSEQWSPIFATWETLIHPDDHVRVIPAALRSVALGEDIEIEWRLKTPETEPVRWFMTRGRPIFGADGCPDRYFGIVIDITERKRMEETVRESEERQSFLLALNDALRAVDEPVEAIAIAVKMLGWKLDANQVVYDKADEIIHEWNNGSLSAFAVLRPEHFDEFIIEDLSNGRTVAVGDVGSDPRMCTPEGRTIFERNSVAAFISVPFVKNDRRAGFSPFTSATRINGARMRLCWRRRWRSAHGKSPSGRGCRRLCAKAREA